LDEPFVDTNDTAVDAVLVASLSPMQGGVWAEIVGTTRQATATSARKSMRTFGPGFREISPADAEHARPNQPRRIVDF